MGPGQWFDLVGAAQFKHLCDLGMREGHKLLDVGCGCLRAGRFFVMYLGVGNYYGIEPDQELLEYGIQEEVGEDLIKRKKATFRNNDDYSLTSFGIAFDFILAHSIFIHAPKPDVETCFNQVGQALKHRGKFVANFVPGPTDNSCSKWTISVMRYTKKFMLEQAARAGLVLEFKPWPHMGQHTWFVCERKGGT